jgi:hypothetical protein
MSLPRKAIVGSIVYLSLLILLYIFLPNLVHRQEFDQAFVPWQKDPSSQNKAILEIQKRMNMVIQLEASAATAFVLWIAGFTWYCVARHIPHRQTGTCITSK